MQDHVVQHLARTLCRSPASSSSGSRTGATSSSSSSSSYDLPLRCVLYDARGTASSGVGGSFSGASEAEDYGAVVRLSLEAFASDWPEVQEAVLVLCVGGTCSNALLLPSA